MVSVLDSKCIILTAALPYASGDLHLGHLVEHLQVDIWSRFLRMLGKNCYTFCGDDTHGIPVMMSAQQEGISCEEYIVQSQINHQRDLKGFHVHYTNYSNTHTDCNRQISEEIYREIQKSGALVEKEVQQFYCSHCSVFLPDRMIEGGCPVCSAVGQPGDVCGQCYSTYDAADLQSPTCVRCNGSPESKISSHLFFSIEKHRKLLREWLPGCVDPSVYKKLLEWLDQPLRDWDITRDGPYFGFAIPGRENQYFYVWLDAPVGYLSCIQDWLEKTGDTRSLSSIWNDPTTFSAHFIGKDIVYFHALFWPCLLEESKLYRKTDKLFVHGFMTVNGEKMSKSKGNYISLKSCLLHLDPTQIRYYVTSQLQIGQDDVNFRAEEFQRRIDSELIGKITNIASRCSALLQRYFEGNLSVISSEDLASVDLFKLASRTTERVYKSYLDMEFSAVIRNVRIFSEEVNKFFDNAQPWKKVESDPQGTQRCLTICLWSFRQITILLTPVLPEYSRKVRQWYKDNEEYTWNSLQVFWDCKKLDAYTHLTSRVDSENLDKIFTIGV